MSKLFDILDTTPNAIIADSFVITNAKLERYDNIMCSISGGADSDVMIDIVSKLDTDKKVHYVFFDTGLEFQATKDHLMYLENKYGVEIEIERAIKPIPLTCRKHGLPFISKKVANNIWRLQRYGFKWEDKPFEVLLKEYPKCTSALRWWCNNWPGKDGRESSFNIRRNKWLKEFMIENPPTFSISDKCCKYAKKDVAKRYHKNNDIELNMYGVRKAEGGQRATAYKSCFTSGEEKGVADDYRPIFWFKNEDRELYERAYDIVHSKCYTEYGMKRTGCAGCPFALDFEDNLELIQQHEPKLYKAVNKIFGESYEYTRKYREFVRMKESESK